MIDEQLGLMPMQEKSTNPKELFDTDDIEGKTEVTSEQVLIIAKLKMLGLYIKKTYDNDIVNNLVQDFLTLQISKDRASRNEFVNAFQSKNDERAGGLMDKFSMNLGGK